MAAIEWDSVSKRLYEVGVDRGVLFVGENSGIPWNGLISVEESPSEWTTVRHYLEGTNYLNTISEEEYEATLTAFYSPPEFDACDGMLDAARGFYAGQQRRRKFNLTYRSLLGNDTQGNDYGYKIHLVYNAMAEPSSRSYSTVNADSQANSLSWKLITTPIKLPGLAPSGHFIVDSSKTNSEALKALEDILYGTDEAESRMPTPLEVQTLFNGFGDFVVINNGDGTFTIIGNDEDVVELGSMFEITQDTVTDFGDGRFEASSSYI